MQTSDDGHMQQALRLAGEGRGLTSPNPMVGAVVVASDGTVVGTGHHEQAGGAHAEVRALDAAGVRSVGGTLYCTLEPCCHHGRTGPCVERIVDAGIARVVVAMIDPNPRVEGRGVEHLRQHEVEVEVGLYSDEASRLNAPFMTWIAERRPFVTMKVAVSLDGYIAGRVGERTVLTSAAADTVVHRLRAEVDGIAVGSNTVLVDDPLLTARGVVRRRPLTRVIFDRRLRIPPTARLFGTLEAGPVVVVTTDRVRERCPDRVTALRDAGADVESVPSPGAIGDVLERLGALGMTHMVVEGGRRVHDALWQGGFVDHVQMFVAPVALGAGGVTWLDRGRVVAELERFGVTACGPDLLLEGDVHRTH